MYVVSTTMMMTETAVDTPRVVTGVTAVHGCPSTFIVIQYIDGSSQVHTNGFSSSLHVAPNTLSIALPTSTPITPSAGTSSSTSSSVAAVSNAILTVNKQSWEWRGWLLHDGSSSSIDVMFTTSTHHMSRIVMAFDDGVIHTTAASCSFIAVASSTGMVYILRHGVVLSETFVSDTIHLEILCKLTSTATSLLFISESTLVAIEGEEGLVLRVWLNVVDDESSQYCTLSSRILRMVAIGERHVAVVLEGDDVWLVNIASLERIHFYDGTFLITAAEVCNNDAILPEQQEDKRIRITSVMRDASHGGYALRESLVDALTITPMAKHRYHLLTDPLTDICALRGGDMSISVSESGRSLSVWKF